MARMVRMVDCVKTGRELEGLDRPPFEGELGTRIFDNISKEAWGMWREHQTLLINHHGLNMADPKATETLIKEMEEFLFSEEAHVPEDWIPESERGTAPAPAAKGAPGAPGDKGAPNQK